MTYCTNHGLVCLCPHGFSLASKGSLLFCSVMCDLSPVTEIRYWKSWGIHKPHCVRRISQRRETVSDGISLWCAFCLAVYSNEPRAPQFLLGCPGLQESRNRCLPDASPACEQGSPGFDGTVLVWSLPRFLILVYGSETVKMCWSGLSFLILRYSNGLLCLSC